MRPYEEGDPVVLPTGRRATIVKRAEEERLVCRYIDTGDLVEVPTHMVRRIERGMVPPPFRYRRVA